MTARDRTNEFYRILNEKGATVAHAAARPSVSEFSSGARQISLQLQGSAQLLARLTELVKRRSLFNDPTAEINSLAVRIKESIQRMNQDLDVLAVWYFVLLASLSSNYSRTGSKPQSKQPTNTEPQCICCQGMLCFCFCIVSSCLADRTWSANFLERVASSVKCFKSEQRYYFCGCPVFCWFAVSFLMQCLLFFKSLKAQETRRGHFAKSSSMTLSAFPALPPPSFPGSNPGERTLIL